MAGDTFGSFFLCHAFGESHGKAMGAVVEGCPAGVPFSESFLERQLKRRRPGHNPWDSGRKEPDKAQVLSGVFEGRAIGTPIALIALNEGAQSSDYSKSLVRQGHADDIWESKYGLRDYRGGGRASGRETISRVMAGAVAQMALKALLPSFQAMAFVRRIGDVAIEDGELEEAEALFSSRKTADDFPARFPHSKKALQVKRLLLKAKEEGESLGALAELWIAGLPAGLGRPVFHKLKAALGAAMLSLGGSAGALIGPGISAAAASGGLFHGKKESYGGLRGGLSTGERIRMQIPFKPPSSLKDVALKGRHDPCVAPRAIVAIEAMAALLAIDYLLAARLDRA